MLSVAGLSLREPRTVTVTELWTAKDGSEHGGLLK
jgi:hypothetical protein